MPDRWTLQEYTLYAWLSSSCSCSPSFVLFLLFPPFILSLSFSFDENRDAGLQIEETSIFWDRFCCLHTQLEWLTTLISPLSHFARLKLTFCTWGWMIWYASVLQTAARQQTLRANRSVIHFHPFHLAQAPTSQRLLQGSNTDCKWTNAYALYAWSYRLHILCRPPFRRGAYWADNVWHALTQEKDISTHVE